MGNRNNFKPPRLFEAILDWYCSDIFLEDLKGDLYEYFNRRSQKHGRTFAQLMFLVDVLRNFKPHLFGRHGANKVNSMDIFFNNLKSIRRNLIRHKLYATINIVGLALGISGGLFISQYVSHELRYEDFHVNKAQVYRITPEYTGEGGFHVHWARTPMSWVDDLVTELPEVKKQIRFQNYYPRIVKIGERSFKEKHGFAVDSDVFEVFSFELLSGEPEIALKEPFSVVLTQSISHKYFGNENPMGQIIQILNEADSSLENYKVTGVMKDLPTNTYLPVNFLTSFRNIEERTGWAYNYIQLIDDTDVNNVRAKLPELIEKYRDPDDLGPSVLHLQPISDIHLYSSLAREIIPNGDIFYVKIFGSAGIFILLMAMINFTNLSTSKALERTREIGVRKVLGSNRRALFGYFMTEAMLYSFIASIVSLILVGYSLHTLRKSAASLWH